MAHFAILRTQKLKSAVAVHRSMKHSFRAQDTPNADAELAHHNEHFGAHSVAEGMAAFRARLPESFRKDAVQAIEYLMTASPEAMASKSREEQDAYFRDALDWLKGRHGAENVVYAGIHRDETTPHMYAYVVPRDPETGRLNAKRWLGGAKALRDMQTEYAEQVGKRHGLERGLKALNRAIRRSKTTTVGWRRGVSKRRVWTFLTRLWGSCERPGLWREGGRIRSWPASPQMAGADGQG